MSDLRSINHTVEHHRTRLAASLDALTEIANPDRLASEARAVADSYGTDLAQQALSKVSSNPTGGILVALGLALMAKPSPRIGQGMDPATTLKDPLESPGEFEARVEAADASIKADMTGEVVGVRKASHLRATIDRGLDQLPADARAKVLEIREAAVAVQDRIEAQARTATRQSKGFVQQQPVAAGILALGFGIIAGSLLPSTRKEDAALGAKRDALMAKAGQVLEQEVERAKTAVEDAIDRQSTDPTQSGMRH